jgi:hypothetical protein
MKEQTITQTYKDKEFSYTAKVPETAEEFAQLLGVNCLDFANKEYLNRLKGNLKGKIKDKKLKVQKAKIQEAVDSFKLRLATSSEAKKELKSMLGKMSDAEALAASEAVAKMRQKEETATEETAASNE